MIDQVDLEQLNGEIAVIADHITRHREIIEWMRADGKDTAAAELALDALVQLYRQRLKMRQALGGSPRDQQRQSTRA